VITTSAAGETSKNTRVLSASYCTPRATNRPRPIIVSRDAASTASPGNTWNQLDLTGPAEKQRHVPANRRTDRILYNPVFTTRKNDRLCWANRLTHLRPHKIASLQRIAIRQLRQGNKQKKTLSAVLFTVYVTAKCFHIDSKTLY